MSDSSGVIASPLTVVVRSVNHGQDHKKIQELIDEYEVDCVVVGMPLSMSGKVAGCLRCREQRIVETACIFSARGTCPPCPAASRCRRGSSVLA